MTAAGEDREPIRRERLSQPGQPLLTQAEPEIVGGVMGVLIDADFDVDPGTTFVGGDGPTRARTS